MKTTDKKFLYLLLFALEFSLVLIAFIITLFTKTPFPTLFTSRAAPAAFITIIAAGIAGAGLASLLVIKLKVFTEIKELFLKLVSGFKLTLIDCLIISLTAGICEEILFRAVLQPMWGIWITSFVFILLHGYFNPVNWKMSLFGMLMFCVSLGLGYIYIKYGLIPAMVFHFIYDLTAFTLIVLNKNNAN